MGIWSRFYLFISLIAVVSICSPAYSQAPTVPSAAPGCCVRTRGNIDGRGIVDLSDISSLISYLVGGGFVLPCPEAADLSGNGTVDLADLSILIAYCVGVPVTLPACVVDTTPITIPERIAALDSVRVKFSSLSGQTHDAIALALSTYIRTLPEFEASGIADSWTVWGRFRDGRMLIIPNNFDPDFPPDSGTVDTVSAVAAGPGNDLYQTEIAPSRQLRSMPKVSAATIPYELPSSADAYLLSGMSHRCYTNPLPTIKALLKRQNYSCITPQGEYASNGTVENLMAIHDAGVFYYDSHGGRGLTRDANYLYALWTSEVVTDPSDTAYDAMLNAGELCYMEENAEVITDRRTCGIIEHYGITPAFVSKYMTFSKNSLVYIDACVSNDPNMKTAFTNAGASVYLGWTKNVTVAFALPTSYYLFDRMLGTNAIANRETPAQRPFDLQAIYADMSSRGMITDPAKGATLILSSLQDHFGLLAPTIKFVSIYEDPTQPHLLVSGEFGSDRGTHGTVTLNGQPIFIRFWSPDTILCDLAGTGAQAVGTVQSYVIPTVGLFTPDEQQLSNKVNISEWNGTMEYTLSGPDSLQADLKMGVHFRADVHPFREKPHQKPFKTLSIFQWGLKDSTGTGNFSGEHDIPSGPCTEKIVMGLKVDMGNVWQATQHGSMKYDGGVDMIHNQLQFNFFFAAADTVGHMNMGGGAGCPNVSYPLQMGVQNDSCLFQVLPNDVFQLTMKMDSTDLSIVPDSTSCERKAIYWLYGFDQMQATAQIKWNKMISKFQPDPKAGE